MSAELNEFSNALADATARAAGSIVAVHTETHGSSSGVIWRPGVVVTSEHALRRDEEIRVTLPDGHVTAATLAGRDPSTDLAALNCAEASAAFAQTAPPDSVRAGSLTLVVGRNGSGKSSFAEAAELALTGVTRRWEGRAAVWREGWRNLHDGSASRQQPVHRPFQEPLGQFHAAHPGPPPPHATTTE